ncbi:hypothetical protein F53441_665 [Fusarium austroafricanum]|uniref:DUF5071 domain-containing protein n=1 Tax=Fusarium austroafricanum TaxID=2364996 RepID=A0A8H4KWB0_9HYPO|nr:hypothetical protein F53441_665 [Fusarium austroafricanum]
MDHKHEMSALSEKDFAAEAPKILWAERDVCREDESDKMSLVRVRATESSTVEAISSILTSPIEEEDFDSLRLHQKAFWILMDLSFDQLQPYRPALTKLAAFDISNFKSRSGHYAQSSHLIRDVSNLERFAADPKAVWVSENKFDEVSYRTLAERIHTAERMRPYMDALFNWQVDVNHPPFMPCREQIARFPETAAVVAAEFIVGANASKDEEFQYDMIDFFLECVPVGEAWRPMHEPVQELVRELEKELKEGNEDREYVLDKAKEWLAKLDNWEASQA